MPEKTTKQWHAMKADDVLDFLDSGQSGLNEQQVLKAREVYGENKLPESPGPSNLKRFLLQFHNLLIYVLLGASAITGLMQHWIDTFVILAVVFINAIIGFFQEGKAQQALQAIRKMLSAKTLVLRDGTKRNIHSNELVPGDIVLIEAGDKISADLRIIKTKNLQTQEAALTGESNPIEKKTSPVAENAALGDRVSMAYSGTLVTSGQGMGVVVAIGDQTQIGQISTMISNIEEMTTPLIRSINTFARWLTIAIIGISSLIFLLAYGLRDFGLIDSFMASVALAVAAIPEGLPAILTITLAIGVERMAKRNAIIRKLPAVETLGSVTTICSDKTGTLTRNEMMLTSLTTPEKTYHFTGTGLIPEGEIYSEQKLVAADKDEQLNHLLTAAVLCSDASLHQSKEQWGLTGDPMEGALIVAAMKANIQQQNINQEWPRIDSLPFASEYRYMATLNHYQNAKKYIFIKGAPEVIFSLCSNLDKKKWAQQVDELAEQGQRVLAMAQIIQSDRKLDLQHQDLEQGAEFLGLFGLIDPPRSEAIESVAQCQSAGITVKMITGDHAGTAKAIGKQLGLNHRHGVLTGAEIDQLDDQQLQKKLQQIDIFARTSPKHKLRLVKALQNLNHIVAMTGDGVNDAPALKQADVGVAMGNKGTESAKEASEVVLADDNFASIALAIKEGRNVYDNLKKAITFLLPINGGESGSILIAIALGLSLPMTPLQVLWVNMVSSVTLALALAFEPAEPNIMKRPPRDPSTPILSAFLVWRIVFVSLLFVTGIFTTYLWSINRGDSIELARTHAVNALVVMEVFYLFSVRTNQYVGLNIKDIVGTKAVIVAGFTVIALQLVFNYAPFMKELFDSRPMANDAGILVLVLGLIMWLILNTEKFIYHKWWNPKVVK